MTTPDAVFPGGDALERSYRRLLALYPRDFRATQGEEMLGVLLTAAHDGQDRPSLLDTIDLVWGALTARLRATRGSAGGQRWREGLAVFSVLGPLLLIVAELLQVAIPYRLVPQPAVSQKRIGVVQWWPTELGGTSLLSQHGFQLILGAAVLIAVLTLIGLRWLSLAALLTTAAVILKWGQHNETINSQARIPLLVAVFVLTAVALIASPGPRAGRRLLSWRHALVTAAVTASVQLWTLGYYAHGMASVISVFGVHQPGPTAREYYLMSVGCAALALILTLALRLRAGGPLILLLAASLWPLFWQGHFGQDGPFAGYLPPGGGYVTLTQYKAYQLALYVPTLLIALWGGTRAFLYPRKSTTAIASDGPTAALPPRVIQAGVAREDLLLQLGGGPRSTADRGGQLAALRGLLYPLIEHDAGSELVDEPPPAKPASALTAAKGQQVGGGR